LTHHLCSDGTSAYYSLKIPPYEASPISWFLPGYHFTGTFQENLQDLERLVLQLDLDAPLAQFSDAQIHFEHAEANRPARWISALHRE